MNDNATLFYTRLDFIHTPEEVITGSDPPISVGSTIISTLFFPSQFFYEFEDGRSLGTHKVEITTEYFSKKFLKDMSMYPKWKSRNEAKDAKRNPISISVGRFKERGVGEFWEDKLHPCILGNMVLFYNRRLNNDDVIETHMQEVDNIKSYLIYLKNSGDSNYPLTDLLPIIPENDPVRGFMTLGQHYELQAQREKRENLEKRAEELGLRVVE